jgi:hypothetical protein
MSLNCGKDPSGYYVESGLQWKWRKLAEAVAVTQGRGFCRPYGVRRIRVTRWGAALLGWDLGEGGDALCNSRSVRGWWSHSLRCRKTRWRRKCSGAKFMGAWMPAVWRPAGHGPQWLIRKSAGVLETLSREWSGGGCTSDEGAVGVKTGTEWGGQG